MNRRLPPLNALRVFEAAARLESFSAAAEQLSVTHGAVSRQISQLEDWLGVALGPLPVIEELLASGKLVTPLPGPLVRVRGYSWVLPLPLAEDPLCADFCAWLEEEGEG